ncbi:MAG: hypothetical protein JSU00_01895 [Acidobacteria bacterium]|nr:hypothetical protein [Acidobacteriota bacterium]
MTSQRKIQANRRNAAHSTGPKTPEGKAASSLNAAAHGLRSAFRLLPHEDPGAFNAIGEELDNEFLPETEHQRFLLRQMVESRWRLERTRRFEAIALEQLISGVDESDPDSVIVGKMSQKAANIFELLRRYANDAERSYYKAHAELVKSGAGSLPSAPADPGVPTTVEDMERFMRERVAPKVEAARAAAAAAKSSVNTPPSSSVLSSNPAGSKLRQEGEGNA